MNLLMNHRDVILDQALNVHTSQMELWDRLWLYPSVLEKDGNARKNW
jgi:hypothetical protein